jgi:hypothetical protein
MGPLTAPIYLEDGKVSRGPLEHKALHVWTKKYLSDQALAAMKKDLWRAASRFYTCITCKYGHYGVY